MGHIACSSSSWMNYWRHCSKRNIDQCPVIGCEEVNLMGTHVQKDGDYDHRWYIVPLCKKHRKHVTARIEDNCPLVSANEFDG